MKNSVLIGPSSFAEIDDAPLKDLMNAGFNVIHNPFKRKIEEHELIALLTEDVIGIIAGLEQLDKNVLSKSNLRIISRVGSGVSNIDHKYSKENNIKIFSIPEGPTSTVAEITVGNIINLLRHTYLMNNMMHKKKWERFIGNDLKGKVVVIVGYGRIGKKVSKILRAMDCEIIVVDSIQQNLSNEYKQMALEEALPMADIVSMHTSGNKCIMDFDQFSLLKKGVYICNASRGSTLSEKALVHYLDKDIIKGAWLDVFEKEPYDGDLSKYPQVILTPHIGSYTKECRIEMEKIAVRNLLENI